MATEPESPILRADHNHRFLAADTRNYIFNFKERTKGSPRPFITIYCSAAYNWTLSASTVPSPTPGTTTGIGEHVMDRRPADFVETVELSSRRVVVLSTTTGATIAVAIRSP